MTLPVDALKALRYCVKVTDSVLRPDDPFRRFVPPLLEDLDTGISTSRSRSENDSARGQLGEKEMIGTREAATILSCTQRRVQQIAASLDGERVGNTWLFARADVINYREAMSNP
jgi:hypothetical protein